jgi:hypothetical protein
MGKFNEGKNDSSLKFPYNYIKDMKLIEGDLDSSSHNW